MPLTGKCSAPVISSQSASADRCRRAHRRDRDGDGGSPAPAAAPRFPVDDYAGWVDLGTGLSLCVGKGVDLVDAVAEEYGVALSVPDGAIAGSSASPDGTASSGSVSADTRAAASTVISVIYDDASYA